MVAARFSGLRFLDPWAVAAVLPAVWGGALAVLAAALGYSARRRLLKPRRPTVDQVRSLVLSVLAILLALAGFALVAPALLVQAQQRLPH